MIITGGTVFLVVSVSMLNKLRLGVLGVAKITNDCVYVHAVCVASGMFKSQFWQLFGSTFIAIFGNLPILATYYTLVFL